MSQALDFGLVSVITGFRRCDTSVCNVATRNQNFVVPSISGMPMDFLLGRMHVGLWQILFCAGVADRIELHDDGGRQQLHLRGGSMWFRAVSKSGRAPEATIYEEL